MDVIKTFVLLDLETSGLPRNSSPCKITEISLVAASRQHILDRHYGISKENNKVSKSLLPRVLNKLLCVVYPCKMIHPVASEVSGLTNEDLEQQRPFDVKLFETISHFMERLEKPICLVAHNGNRFDFPLLQSELSKINKALPEDVFCADSLLGFREVLVTEYSSEKCESSNLLIDIKPLNGDVCFDPCKTLPECDWSSDEYDIELIQAVDLAEKITNDEGSFDVKELERKINMEMERIRKYNERTPGRKTRKTTTDHFRNGLATFNSNSNVSDKTESVRRRLVKDTPKPKRKYNLGSLYESLTGKVIMNAHQAETDTLALLECLTAVGKPIIEWIDNNKIPFRSVKRMW